MILGLNLSNSGDCGAAGVSVLIHFAADEEELAAVLLALCQYCRVGVEGLCTACVWFRVVLPLQNGTVKREQLSELSNTC